MEHPKTSQKPALSLEDRYAIEALYARYNQAVDAGDIEAWMSVYASHASFRGGGIRLNGHDELRRFAEGEAQRMHVRGYARMQHWTANLLIEGNGHRARGRCYLILFQQPENRPSTCHFHVASYRDEFEKIGGQWFFVERNLEWWVHPPLRRSFLSRLQRLPAKLWGKSVAYLRGTG